MKYRTQILTHLQTYHPNLHKELKEEGLENYLKTKNEEIENQVSDREAYLINQLQVTPQQARIEAENMIREILPVPQDAPDLEEIEEAMEEIEEDQMWEGEYREDELS